jgi:uncharacterized protein
VTVERFSVRDIPATPWKNGGGTTQEIAAFPPGSNLDGFLWRVSIATIAADGPFSAFKGIDRSIMLLDGAGVRLRSSDGTIDHRLDRLHQPFAFSGDVALDGIMLGGSSRDFNVMSRRGRGIARLDVITAPATLDRVPCGVALCLRGRWRSAQHELGEGEGLRWVDVPDARQFSPATDNAAMAVATWTPMVQ